MRFHHHTLSIIPFILGFVFASLFWVVESVLHRLIFSPGGSTIIWWPTDPNELWMRLIIAALFILLGCVSAWLTFLYQKSQHKIFISHLAFDAITECVVVTDKDNRILYTNPAYSRVTGFSAEEALGKNPKIASSGKQDKAFYKNLWNQLLTKGHWEGEVWNRRKTGELYPEWLSINTIRNQANRIEYFVGVFSDTTAKKQVEERMKHYAYYDPLTDLPNRRLFLERLQQSINYAKRNQALLAVMYIDIDHFKQINDQYGHDVGDAYLCQFTKAVKQQLREVDTVSRFGGDEFVILLTALKTPDDAMTIGKKILAIKTLQTNEHTLPLQCSIGIACYPSHAQEPESLLQHADSAMYQVKHSGRNDIKMWCA